MIELLWQGKDFCDFNAFVCVTGVLSWITQVLAENEENHDIELNGFLVAKSEQKISTLILCDIDVQQRLLKILQQPPEQYKGKYIPCILSQEPESVQEISETDSEEDSGNIVMEVEEEKT